MSPYRCGRGGGDHRTDILLSDNQCMTIFSGAAGKAEIKRIIYKPLKDSNDD